MRRYALFHKVLRGLAKYLWCKYLTDYLDRTVKPQIISALKRVQLMDEYVASIPDEVKYADMPADS